MAMTTLTKRNKKKTKILIVIILILVSLLLSLLFAFRGRQDVANKDTSSSDYHLIQYDGKEYRYNSSIVTIAFMGIDSTSDSKQLGQADALQLCLLNRDDETIKVITLSRDIMTDIHMFDVEHNDLGWDRQHLALAYAYGDSPKNGAMLTTQAISKLLYDIPINYFAAMDLSILPELQNVVGELEVIVPNDSLVDVDPSWTKGSTVVLNADNVEKFVRKRNIEQDYSNEDRMERQKAYISAYVDKIRQMLKNDFDKTVQLLYNVCKNMTTNISLENIQSFSSMLLSYSFDSNTDFYSVKGTDQTGTLHDEFEVDQDALKQLVVDLFYKEED